MYPNDFINEISDALGVDPALRFTTSAKNFGKLNDALDAPDLIEIQLNSYSEFLQLETKPSKRNKRGNWQRD